MFVLTLTLHVQYYTNDTPIIVYSFQFTVCIILFQETRH